MLRLSHVVREVAGDRYLNGEGGDVRAAGSRRLLLRHAANYAAAAELAAAHAPAGPVVDVGSGVGALGVWLAGRLGRPLQLVDADPRVASIAAEAFPETAVALQLGDIPPRSAGVITAMEVIEHLPPSEHLGFVRRLVRRLRPGGLLVISTPDESGYLGGWSGYAPHIGVLDAAGLRRLLAEAGGDAASVWRLEGEVFRLGLLRRMLQPLSNRLWSQVGTSSPTAAARIGQTTSALLTRLRRTSPREPTEEQVSMVPADTGRGDGLIGALWAPTPR